MPRKKRLDPAIFNLPVEKMKAGYYSDKYFVRAREVLLKDKHRPRVTMQVFGKTRAYVGGIDEAIAILKLCAEQWQELEVFALYDGDKLEPWETVLLIEAPTTPSPTSRRCTSACWRGARASAPTPTSWSRPRVPNRSCSSPPGTTTGWCRPATAMRPTSPGRSAARPARRPRGGARGGGAPSP